MIVAVFMLTLLVHAGLQNGVVKTITLSNLSYRNTPAEIRVPDKYPDFSEGVPP